MEAWLCRNGVPRVCEHRQWCPGHSGHTSAWLHQEQDKERAMIEQNYFLPWIVTQSLQDSHVTRVICKLQLNVSTLQLTRSIFWTINFINLFQTNIICYKQLKKVKLSGLSLCFIFQSLFINTSLNNTKLQNAKLRISVQNILT